MATIIPFNLQKAKGRTADSSHWDSPNHVYKGYPYLAPGLPLRSDMQWYTDPQRHFGTWVVNASPYPIEFNGYQYGWSGLVYKSTAPVYESANVPSLLMRKHLAWIVDLEGYGQYGIVEENGTLWVPSVRPEGWMPPEEQ
ncbi:hypothetical protein [Paenibacillus gansuensis]|uniref:Uncharacterized protein n=1 Tax=Paenibacillus gansuensis TaxID=306542 RepID=A0ABW5PDT3_9BACL